MIFLCCRCRSVPGSRTRSCEIFALCPPLASLANRSKARLISALPRNVRHARKLCPLKLSLTLSTLTLKMHHVALGHVQMRLKWAIKDITSLTGGTVVLLGETSEIGKLQRVKVLLTQACHGASGKCLLQSPYRDWANQRLTTYSFNMYKSLLSDLDARHMRGLQISVKL